MTINQQPKILVLTRFYLPGVSAGGPIKSVSNLVNALGEEFCFQIITLNKDLNSEEEYSAIIPGSSTLVGKASVIYLKNNILLPFKIIKTIRNSHYDLIYINSFFDPIFSIFPMLILRFYPSCRLPVLLAPRGELSLGALGLKRLKKNIFINFARLTNLYKDIIWHASTANESNDIRRVFSPVLGSISTARVISASDIANIYTMDELISETDILSAREFRLCFLSRITEMKNLLHVLKILKDIQISIELAVYGPIEDHKYWEKCQKLIDLMPSNIKVKYFGPVNSSDVVKTIASYDLFILPTLGENYGHVIVEAWAAGVPVLISDQTPWRNLKKKNVGWDIPNTSPDLFKEALIEASQWTIEKRNEVKKYCHQEANLIINSYTVISDNRTMLQKAINSYQEDALQTKDL